MRRGDARRKIATMPSSAGRGSVPGPASAMDFLRRTRPGFPSGLEVREGSIGDG